MLATLSPTRWDNNMKREPAHLSVCRAAGIDPAGCVGGSIRQNGREQSSVTIDRSRLPEMVRRSSSKYGSRKSKRNSMSIVSRSFRIRGTWISEKTRSCSKSINERQIFLCSASMLVSHSLSHTQAISSFFQPRSRHLLLQQESHRGPCLYIRKTSSTVTSMSPGPRVVCILLLLPDMTGLQSI